MIRILVLNVCLILSLTVAAQVDYNKQYFNAKDLFRQGKYNLAMEAFKPLIPYDQKNKYAEYSSYYYALSAYRQGFRAVAKDMLNQIKKLYPKWDKMNEVNYLLGKIHFDDQDYFQGLKIFSAIDDKSFEKDIEGVKKHHLAKVTDVETVRMMHEDYPKDPIIATSLAHILSKSTTAEDQKLLHSLIDNFKLKKTDFIVEAPKTFLKEKYSVSVLLPFMVNTLEPTAGKKRNQIVLDFYEGMKLAADTLNPNGTEIISLRAYDTERSADKLKRILNTEELKKTDLVVGPFFPEESKAVQEFSVANKVNVVNPFSNNSEIIGDNPYSFLFQPSSETLGMKSAEYIAARTSRKNSMVFYGPSKKDSIMAANYVKRAADKGLKVVSSQLIRNKETKRIIEILATPTEFDEFKYPSQFTLKKDSIGSIYVASDDPLIYSEVVGAVETRADSIKVIGSENWIDDTALDPEKYQTLHITLAAPNYSETSSREYRDFFNKFVKTYGRTPSSVARMGFELMMFFGNQLKTNGVFFQENLSKAGTVPGYLYEGFNYQNSRNNQLVPFIRFRNGDLTLVEKR